MAVYFQFDPTAHGKIFIDGLVLTAGEFSNTSPSFSDPDGTQGNWDGQSFQNLIHNGSAERGALGFRSWFDKLNTKLSGAGVNLPIFLATIQDWKMNGWFYRDAFATLFRTFWASLAGDKVVPSPYVNYILIFMSFVGVGGTVYLMWSKRKELRWDIVFILGMSFLAPWALALTRGVSGFLIENPLYPWARYAYPAIIPTALVLCAGWWEWFRLLKEKFKLTDTILAVFFLGGMFGLSALSMVTAVRAFHHVGVTIPLDFLLRR